MAISPTDGATTGNDTIYGGTGNDEINALAGNDLVLGLAGEDLIYGEDGDDSLYGGDYNDTIYGGNGNDAIFGDGMVDSLYGDAGNDWIELGYLFGGSIGMADGGAGNDTLRVFDTGDATLIGGTGIDLIEIAWLPLLVADDVTIDFDAGIARSGFGQNVTFSEFERLSVYLSLGDDVVSGSSQDDFLWVDAGANQVDAKAGHDTVRYLIGDANTLEGGAGLDRLIAYSGNTGSSVYFIYDSYEGDVDDGQLSLITGFEAFDVIGGEQNDIISTGGGNDALYGNGGDDTLAGKVGQDRIYGGGGNDDINGGADSDILGGGSGNDTMIGSSGRDQLTGGTGADQLFGGVEADWLNGGWGFDTLTGGGGADVFYHLGVAGHGSDSVMDYNAAEGDVLVYGNAFATQGDFRVQFAASPLLGDPATADAFIVNWRTGQIVWVLADGSEQENIWLRVAGQTFDLLD